MTEQQLVLLTQQVMHGHDCQGCHFKPGGICEAPREYFRMCKKLGNVVFIKEE